LTAVFLTAVFFAAVFFAAVFLTAVFLTAVFLTAVFLTAVFLTAVFFAAVFFAAVFFAAVFFAAVFLTAVFFAAVFLTAVFFAAVFFDRCRLRRRLLRRSPACGLPLDRGEASSARAGRIVPPRVEGGGAVAAPHLDADEPPRVGHPRPNDEAVERVVALADLVLAREAPVGPGALVGDDADPLDQLGRGDELADVLAVELGLPERRDVAAAELDEPLLERCRPGVGHAVLQRHQDEGAGDGEVVVAAGRPGGAQELDGVAVDGADLDREGIARHSATLPQGANARAAGRAGPRPASASSESTAQGSASKTSGRSHSSVQPST
jgi:hypothetical protein